MNINSTDFTILLLVLLAVTGLVAILDAIFWAPKRKQNAIEKLASRNKEPVAAKAIKAEAKSNMNWAIDLCRGLFPVFLIVVILRSFFVEPYRIPSGSLEPTLLVGDFVLVNKYTYGLRVPVLNNKFMSVGSPKKGDIVVFHFPKNPDIDFIKRIVGTPGDTVEYKNKILYINGVEQPQKHLGYSVDNDGKGNSWKVEVREETINSIKHKIYIIPDAPSKEYKWVVPEGKYLAFGDNRDDSDDSRSWGFVPDRNLVGKAFMTWFSWNGQTDSVRWKRIGHSVR